MPLTLVNSRKSALRLVVGVNLTVRYRDHWCHATLFQVAMDLEI